MQRLEKIWTQKAAPKVPEWPSYRNFGKVTQNPHFLKKQQRRDQGKFFKNRPKSSPRLRSSKKTLRQMALSSNKYTLIAPKLEKILAQNGPPKMPEWKSYGKFRKVTLNPHFSEKVERGDQGKFLKNRPKSSPCLKGPKALWRKLNYTLIKMLLKCKHWKIFWRKQRLKKCPNGQVMAI